MTYNLDWLIKKHMQFFQKFGMDESNIRGYFETWKAKSQNDSVKDYLWYIFQVLLTESSKQSKTEEEFYKNNLDIYSEMLFFMRKEKRKANDIVQSIEECRIRLCILQLPYKFTVKLSSANCCTYCDDLSSRDFTPEQILQHSSFDLSKCTRELGCTCRTISIPLRNSEGGLILRKH